VNCGRGSTGLPAGGKVAACLLAALLASHAVAARPVELSEVLRRAGEYVTRYERELSGLLCEEDYNQLVLSSGRLQAHRETLSDFLLLRVSGGKEENWFGFRDIFKVDGQSVRDREQRLAKLFLGGTSDPFTEATRIAEESSRYNIGGIERTINVPTLTLTFLDPGYQPRFGFEKLEERVAGKVSVWVVRYTEKTRPTVITSGEEDLFSHGSFWLAPEDGRVLRTELLVENPRRLVKTALTVQYREDEKLAMWLPALMTEHYESWRGSLRESIQCEAKYRNFRKFAVASETTIERPLARPARPPQ
jgi:hypothetical protein